MANDTDLRIATGLTPRRYTARLVAGVLLALPGLSAAGMQSLSEDELSGVSGRDGIEYYITSPAISATGLRLDADNSSTAWAQMTDACIGGVNCGSAYMRGLRMTPTGGPAALNAYLKLDVGSNTINQTMNAAGTASTWLSYEMHIDRALLGGVNANTGFTMGVGGSTRTFGEIAMVTPLDFRFAGAPFYGVPNANVDVALTLSDAKLFYRQGGAGNAILTANNLNFTWLSPTDIADVQYDSATGSSGFRMSGPASTLRLAFDLLYKSAPAAAGDMISVSALDDRPIVHFGWGGTLYDTTLYLRGGGIWDTSVNAGTDIRFEPVQAESMQNMPATSTQGLSLGLRWNYRSKSTPNTPGDFLLSIGHASGDREYVEFGDWKNLEGALGPVANRYGFDIPMLVVDAIANGSGGTNAGGSLCWGAQMTGAACSANINANGDSDFDDVHVDTKGTLLTLRAGNIEGYAATLNSTTTPTILAVIRNANLLAWSNSVRMWRDPTWTATTSAPTEEGQAGGYNWGLTYTLPNINANISLYPGGSETNAAGGSRENGVIFDALLMSQTYNAKSDKVTAEPWQSNYLAGASACNPGTFANCTDTQRWTTGGHFMIADTTAPNGTGTGMGIGFLGSSVLLAMDDARLWLKNTSAGQTYPANYDGGLDLFSPRTRIAFRGMFAGARLPRGYDLVRGLNLDLNLEGLFNLRLSPTPSNVLAGKTAESNDFLAYSMAARLRCGADVGVVFNFGCGGNTFTDAAGSTVKSGLGSYISIEEPGLSGVDLRFGDLSGDLALTGGAMQLRSGTDTDIDNAPDTPVRGAGTRPELVVAQKILIGASAGARLTDGVIGAGVGVGGAAGRALTSNVSFGGNYIFSVAIPAASMYSALTLLPQ